MTRRRQLLDLEVSGEFSQPDVTVAPRYAADELPAPLYGSAQRRPLLRYRLLRRPCSSSERLASSWRDCLGGSPPAGERGCLINNRKEDRQICPGSKKKLLEISNSVLFVANRPTHSLATMRRVKLKFFLPFD